MPIDILRRPNIWGESIAKGVEGLAQGHLKYLQEKQKKDERERGINLLEKGVGLPREVAEYAQSLPPKEQLQFIQSLAMGGYGSSGGMNALKQSTISGNNQQPLNAFEQQQELIPEQRSQMSEGERLGKQIFGAPAQQMTEGEELGQKIFGNNPPAKPTKKLPPGVEPKTPKALPPQVKQNVAKTPLEAMRANHAKKEEELVRKEAIKQAAEDRKEQQSLRLEGDKMTKDFYDETLKKHKVNKETGMYLDRMLKIENSPSGLPNTAWYNFLKKTSENFNPLTSAGVLGGIGGALGRFGGPVAGALGTAGGAALGGIAGAVIQPIADLLLYQQRKQYPAIDEYQKLSSNFIKGAKAIFGSRITDADLEAFMATVPTLNNTPEGRKAIINNMQIINKAADVEFDIMDRIIKENGGHRPQDIELQIEREARPILDRLAKEFVEGYQYEADKPSVKKQAYNWWDNIK